MRNGRIKEDQAAYYHIMSRVVDRRRVFDDREKERFRLLMRDVEAFCGVQVTTYSALHAVSLAHLTTSASGAAMRFVAILHCWSLWLLKCDLIEEVG